MFKSAAALILVLLAFASAAIAQNNFNSDQLNFVAKNESGGSDLTRSRLVDTKSDSMSQLASAAEREAFDLINKLRADDGHEPLVWDDQLAVVARLHSQNMAAYKFFSHRGTDGATVDERADKVGIRDWKAIGENIAFTRGFDGAASFAVSRWMESPAHRKNLLDKRWTQTAIGVAVLPDGTYYFTQVFLLRD